MEKKQVRFSTENVIRLNKTGTCGDDADKAFEKLLDQNDDIDMILLCDEEPVTEKIKLLKRKWCGK